MKPDWRKKRRLCLWAVLILSVMLPVKAWASDITYSFGTEPSITKTIRWSISSGADEYRYTSGSMDEFGYDQAAYAGSGSGASITVEENGNYTLYAKKDGKVYYVQIPITSIDRTPPQINITDIVSTSDRHVSVFYEIEDYFGVQEVRYKKGKASEAEYSSATVVHGGVIENLEDGTYTVFAMDLAGNVSVYTMAVASDYRETESSSYESTEWAKTDLWTEPAKTPPTTAPTETEPEEPPTSAPPETSPPTETSPPPETNPPPEESSRPTRPDHPGRETPGRVPEETPEASIIPTNPTVPTTAPPIERYPQTGTPQIVNILQAAAVAICGIMGIVLLVFARKRERGTGPGDDKEI